MAFRIVLLAVVAQKTSCETEISEIFDLLLSEKIKEVIHEYE